MTALTQLSPTMWVDLEQVERVELEYQTGRRRNVPGDRIVLVDVVLRSREGLFTRVRVPSTELALPEESRDLLVQSWLAAHLGPILPPVLPRSARRDVPGKCGERDCPEPHP